jgi:hypothetical protein
MTAEVVACGCVELLPAAKQCKEKEEENYEREKRENINFTLLFNITFCGPGSIQGQVMWDLWWTERHWRRFSPSTSVSLATQSIRSW